MNCAHEKQAIETLSSWAETEHRLYTDAIAAKDVDVKYALLDTAKCYTSRIKHESDRLVKIGFFVA